MLTCIACSKQLGGPIHGPEDEDDDPIGTPATRHAIKALTTQIKDLALRHCKPCSKGKKQGIYSDSEGFSGSERFHYAYQRAGELPSMGSTPRVRSGEATPSLSGRSMGRAAVLFMTEDEPKEWVAQVEPGVLITFLSLPQGGNDLRRIRFSRDMFNKWQAQRWWADNYDKVMELYNVHRSNPQSMPFPSHPRSEDESSKIESTDTTPAKVRLPCNISHHQQPATGSGASSNALDSLGCHRPHSNVLSGNSSGCRAVLASTPKLSNISGVKTETSSVDASARTTSSSHEDEEEEEEADRSEEMSVSNASDQETEWVEQDEPGVYITIRALPNGTRELRRIRFSRERFGEMHARLWWEENRARIHGQYL